MLNICYPSKTVDESSKFFELKRIRFLSVIVKSKAESRMKM